ncbi:hypothetical protein [Deinococcus soli (ex Cha et al. 2016)]|uniref:Uncharacterized protein n=2 Tax=Deinococcus soli (ex Cha et al. 2016) TaxID=1309411 RepID=A0AAE4BNM0_9DEIO|nr:hypothetical protein [Deinococcus soli (ex Cha et al. 2016)]MDR6218856.1 hypothetical protein [Deinococcus soli (ex Cha et al. 2016)]MDR6328653.1 hypothetical protein [Deinococcus soli (ex Cha et al. 2016)]MDR6751860.1 hypothetical protein [Deinococcus soli (ex Cha et al. 2016)]
MQNRELTAQARRLSAALKAQLGATVGHQKALHLLALAQGYSSYAELQAGAPDAPVTAVLTPQALRQRSDQAGTLRADLAVPLDTLTRLADVALDQYVSRALTGTDLLRRVTATVSGAIPAQNAVVLTVTADASLLLELNGAPIPDVTCRLHDGSGELAVTFDAARHFMTFTDHALVHFITRSLNGNTDSMDIAFAARTWDADVEEFFTHLPDDAYATCEYDPQDTLHLAVITRPHLHGALLHVLREQDADLLDAWQVDLAAAETLAVQDLQATCAAHGLLQDDLDELVYDAKGTEASDENNQDTGEQDEHNHDTRESEAASINNGGPAEQLRYLLGHHGSVAAVQRLLRGVAGPHT